MVINHDAGRVLIFEFVDNKVSFFNINCSNQIDAQPSDFAKELQAAASVCFFAYHSWVIQIVYTQLILEK